MITMHSNHYCNTQSNTILYQQVELDAQVNNVDRNSLFTIKRTTLLIHYHSLRHHERVLIEVNIQSE
jgi:hypothetical protein